MTRKEDLTEKLTAYLRGLHLPTLRECFGEHAQRALQVSSSYQQYLLELVERECQARLRSVRNACCATRDCPWRRTWRASTWRGFREGFSPGADADGRLIRQPSREPVVVRQDRRRQDAFAVGDCPGVGSCRTANGVVAMHLCWSKNC